MKVDISRLKKGTSEVPPECQTLIDKLRTCSRKELKDELTRIETWTFGKCELYHWIDVLDIFDTILEEASEFDKESDWNLAVDERFKEDEIKLVLLVLNFTTLLIEHSFSRHLYNSVEYLITLLQTNNLDVVLAVLNLLYMFSKRSNFISRINPLKKFSLLNRVSFLAESWGGKEQGFGLAECCVDGNFEESPYHKQYFEFFNGYGKLECIPKTRVNGRDPRHVADYVCQKINEIVTEDQKIHIYSRIRTSIYFFDYNQRLKFVQARLQALSILVYSNALLANVNLYLYPGFMEELVDLLQLQKSTLVEIQAAALRTLTSIIHLDRNPHFPKKPGSRLYTIIDVTGASSYHGFLPGLVRSCIVNLINPTDVQQSLLFPMPLATALFSFLYHLASYESGGEALVSSGMMDSLLRVINWPGTELEHITFVTRAVRVIDLITNMDMQSFQNYAGLYSFINRLEMEVNLCRKEQPFEIQAQDEAMQIDDDSVQPVIIQKEIPTHENLINLMIKTSKVCLPQRAALLKSMLNFLKKAIQDAAFSESIRHVMEGSLPSSLRHIISNAEYYGPSLFLLATDVVTVYVFQEPTLLSFLQDIGLTDVVLQALLRKDVPATREVLGSLPNVFSALCLNSRGLQSFVKYNPFDKLFRVLLSPIYLSAMRRRRSSDPMGDTASNLGNAMDELMRHQPSLRHKSTSAVIKLLDDLVHVGTDPKFICWRAQNKGDQSPTTTNQQTNSNPTTMQSSNRNNGTGNDPGSSDDDDEDDEEEEEASTSSSHHHNQNNPAPVQQTNTTNEDTNERTPIPLIDYILNVMKFVDAILSNNSTDDHCKEFVNQGGLKPLLSILALPNLPIDSPITASAQAVAAVCKSILNLSHEPRVLQIGLEQLADVVEQLKPLTGHLESPGGSVLLRELANCPSIEGAFSSATYTPLLHAMSAVHGYVVMLVHVCRTGQTDIRTLSLQKWGQDTRHGKRLLQNLVQLYTALVWESTLLLALCTDDIIPPGCDFAREDMDKLVPGDFKGVSEITWDKIVLNNRRVGVAKIVETLENGSMEFEIPQSSGLGVGTNINMDTEQTPSTSRHVASPSPAQLKYIKALLGASSRLGRALAELFGLLVKLCVGSPLRQRRGQNFPPPPSHTSTAAKEIARVLSHILVDGLSFDKLPPSPVPKLKLTFLICSVGFTSPMLFDDKRYAYHLMLEKFVAEGGLEAFFGMFRWALTGGGSLTLLGAIESPDLPDGTGEFLDAWLLLLEKLTNPKAILESPHIITTTTPSTLKNSGRTVTPSDFDGVSYLRKIHGHAYTAVTQLWGFSPLRTYGTRMSESILTILRHIVRGEGVIKERCDERSKEFRPEHVRQLMEMGFTKRECEEALAKTGCSLEQATDFLLSQPLPREGKSSGGNSSSDQSTTLAQRAIDRFTDECLYTSLRLLDQLPETVYRVCDLLVAIVRRNGPTWRDAVLDILVEEISDSISYLLRQLEKRTLNDVDNVISSDMARKSAVRIHLFTLLFEGHCQEDMRVPCALAMIRINLPPRLLKLLLDIEYMMTNVTNKDGSFIGTPKWLAPLLLLIDLYEKVTLQTQRRNKMHQVTTRIWKWYDLTTGKWNAYSESNNRIINDAYWAGESSVRVACGRQRFTINFSCMSQVNEETGNHRPVILSLKVTEKENNTSSSSDDSSLSSSQGSDTKDIDETSKDSTKQSTIKIYNDLKMSRSTTQTTSTSSSTTATTKPVKAKSEMDITIHGLEKFETKSIVSASVRLMSLPIDRDTLHALMRVCLRLTRNFENAAIFARDAGVKTLLNLGQNAGYLGFPTLATLLIRHTLEEPTTLSHAIEHVIASRTLPSLPPGYKELLYMTRQMSAAVSRNPIIFSEVASEMLRIDISVLRRSPLVDDNRLLLRSTPVVQLKPFRMKETISVQVVHDLLLSLVDSHIMAEGQQQVMVSTSGAHLVSAPTQSNVTSAGNNNNIKKGKNFFFTIGFEEQNWDTDEPVIINKPEEKRSPPLLPKSAILKILAEAVRSYATVALVIVDFCYTPENCSYFNETTTALAFILDRLLPTPESLQDRECASAARMLIAALAACADSACRVQNIVASEVKNALLRSLKMDECTAKHNRIQLLAEVIQTMIESCPPENPALLKLHQYQPRRSAIFYIMYRKAILTDLARASQSIDFTSINAVNTINALLKPLETLIRLSNQPTIASRTKKISDIMRGGGSSNAAANTTTNQQQTTTTSSTTPTTTQTTRTSGSGVTTTTATATDTTTTPSLLTTTSSTASVTPTTTTSSITTDSLIPTPICTIQEQIGDVQVNIEEIMDHFLDRGSPTITVTERGGGDTDSTRVEREPAMETSSESGGDSDSNPSENDEREMDDEEENDDDGEEEEERSEMDVDEETRQFIEFYDQHHQQQHSQHVYGRHLSPSIAELERGSDDILMIQFTTDQSGGNSNNGNGGNGNGGGGNNQSNTTESPQRFLFPPLDETTNQGPSNGNGSNNSGINSNINPIPSTSHHPLLVGRSSNSQNSQQDSIVNTRNQQRLSTRQRRYQYLNINARNTNPPPVILQRLLGPNASSPHGGVNSNSNNGNGNGGNGGTTASTAFRDATRVVLMDNSGFGLFSSSNDEETIDVVDHAGYLFGRSLAATLNNTPSALHWWTEEAKVLGLESQSDICLTVCSNLIPDLELQKSSELSKTKVKKKKKLTLDQKINLVVQKEQRNRERADREERERERLREQQQQLQLPHLLSIQRQNSDSNEQRSENSMDTSEPLTIEIRVRSCSVRNVSGQQQQNQDIQQDTPPRNRNRRHQIRPGSAATARNDEDEDDVEVEVDVDDEDEEDHDDDDVDDEDDDDDDEEDEELTQHDTTTSESTNVNAQINDEEESNSPPGPTLLERERDIYRLLNITADSDTDEYSSEHESDNTRQRVVTTAVPITSSVPLTNVNIQTTAATTTTPQTAATITTHSSIASCVPIVSATISQTTTTSSAISVTTVTTITAPSHPNTALPILVPAMFLPFRCPPENPNPPMPIAIPDTEMETAASIPLPNDDDEDDEDFREENAPLSRQELGELREQRLQQFQSVERLLQQNLNANDDDDNEEDDDEDDDDDDEEGAAGGELEENSLLIETSTPPSSLISYSTNITTLAPSQTETRTTSSAILDESLRTILGDIEIPEGVDPSFLAALPDDMRAEVLSEHIRMQRNRARSRQQQQQQASSSSSSTTSATTTVGGGGATGTLGGATQLETAAVDVNPEFLAALPPNIQEEVLAQQRLERQRQAAATTNPNDPVDAAAFFQNLQPSLRQAILTDMEESQISVLPPELAAEAQTLRRDWESRNRQLMQERLLNQIGTSPNFSSVLRYRRHNLPRPRWSNWNSTGNSINVPPSINIPTTNLERLSPLLDHESLSSILVLIFLVDSRLSQLRLQRIIRHLCVHVPTRDWIIKSLISILERCNANGYGTNMNSKKNFYENGPRPSWLGFKVDPSIGSTANVFNFREKRIATAAAEDELEENINDNNRAAADDHDDDNINIPVVIHPQAVTPVCRQVIDLLTSIAKIFPMNFLPIKRKKSKQELDETATQTSTTQTTTTPSTSASAATASTSTDSNLTDFWDVLLNLDERASERIRHGINAFGPYSMTSRRANQFDERNEFLTFNETPLGKLIPMLNNGRSQYVSDKLLRLLSLVSVGLSDERLSSVHPAFRNKTRERLDVNLLPETDEQLTIVVDALTSGSCSEEGLEDATNIILNLSKCSGKTRTILHELLINSVKQLADKVEKRIVDLMKDVSILNQDLRIDPAAAPGSSGSLLGPSTSSGSSGPSTSSGSLLAPKSPIMKGALRDRFTKDTIVIATPTNLQQKLKTNCDIHLTSMGPLTSKSSSQATFLRVLKVIIQIREGVKLTTQEEQQQQQQQQQTTGSTSTTTTTLLTSEQTQLGPLSDILKLNVLWTTLSECLVHLEKTADHHAVLVLQPAVEAFFLVHASLSQQRKLSSTTLSSSSSTTNNKRNNDDDQQQQQPPLSPIINSEDTVTDQKKFLQFAEKHRTVLNQILRQSTSHLADGPFACLVDHARILDFDVKRRYFRTELERMDEGVRREELAVHVHRVTVFEDSFRELYRRSPEEWKNRFYIVFEDEEGQDAGGLLREWYVIISREIFNPMYALFTVSPGDRVTYMINPSSHANPNHLCYYKFVGRVIAKAIYDNKLLECYFTRSFYKHILGIQVKYTDMESEDYDFYKGLVFLLENKITTLGYDLTFSLEVQEFGVTSVRDLIHNGRNIIVTEDNKLEYIHMVCQLKMSGSIKQQLNAFLEGFYDIIPKRLISIFNEQELELLISGLPNIDIEDLRVNTEYHKYQPNSIQIQWFWRALRSFNQAERAKFLQFVTGTSKVPLQGFAALEGMNGIQKFQIHRDDRSTDRLPSAHTCFNQLDLPVYKTYDKLRISLLKAIHECTEGFGFA